MLANVGVIQNNGGIVNSGTIDNQKYGEVEGAGDDLTPEDQEKLEDLRADHETKLGIVVEVETRINNIDDTVSEMSGVKPAEKRKKVSEKKNEIDKAIEDAEALLKKPENLTEEEKNAVALQVQKLEELKDGFPEGQIRADV